MTKSLQSILSEREKAFREKIATPAYLLGDAEPIAYHLANVLSFHAETARLVWEAAIKRANDEMRDAEHGFLGNDEYDSAYNDGIRDVVKAYDVVLEDLKHIK